MKNIFQLVKKQHLNRSCRRISVTFLKCRCHKDLLDSCIAQLSKNQNIKEFYSDSNGNTVNNPGYLEKSQRKLIREQRKFSRKQKGSNNRNKQRIRVARVHEKLTNQLNDFLQKQSSVPVSENQLSA